MCRKHYQRWAKGHNPAVERPKWASVEVRFWAKVGEPNERGCREWIGARDKNGYGRFTPHFGQKQEAAHSFAYQLTVGPIPAGLWVLHHCDNPPCVEPSHLYAGTAVDNARDRKVRGRGAVGDRNGNSRARRLLRIGGDAR